MTGDRVSAILRRVANGDDSLSPAERLGELCVSALTVSGVGLSVVSESGNRSTVVATDAVSEQIEELQVLLGEGPCVDAQSSGEPVLMSDLRGDSAASRWPTFTPTCLDAGAEAVFALPLQVGAIRIGAIDLYRETPGGLHDFDLALAYAEAALRVVVDWPQGPAGLEPGGPQRQVTQTQVHHAAGMVMGQLDTDIGSAFAALRAYAYRADRPLGDVARDVVAGRIRLGGPNG